MVHARGDGDLVKCAHSAFTLLLDEFRRRDRFLALQARSEYEAANKASQEVRGLHNMAVWLQGRVPGARYGRVHNYVYHGHMQSCWCDVF
jgi:hypothetical protein